LEFKWYIVRTFSGHENKVKNILESELKHRDFQDKITNVLIPSEKVFEMKDGKKKSKTKNFFPGYILVEADLTREVFHFIQNVPSVISFLGTKTEPVPLRPDEVKRILGKMDEAEKTETYEVPFSSGDHVKVTDGPFNNFEGIIQEVHPEKMKVKVMVSIFGRKTPVELDFFQVEPIKGESLE